MPSSKISKVTKETAKRTDHLSLICSNIPRLLDPDDSNPLSARGINRLLSSIRVMASFLLYLIASCYKWCTEITRSVVLRKKKTDSAKCRAFLQGIDVS